jgi:phosphatidylglycerophosphatase A
LPGRAFVADARLGLPQRHPAVLIATGFGLGLLPFAPGTWGSLAALAVGWSIRTLFGVPGLSLAFLGMLGGGWWAAGTVSKASGLRDPAAIVVDEIAGQWLVLLGLVLLGPVPLAAPNDIVAWVLAFLLFRLFDIWKPWPVRWADSRLAGGFGIMLDDLLAAGYAVAALWALLRIGRACGVLG